jgi:hypothetical protein
MLRVLHPSLLFANTTPTGGDMGAHVWAPAFLRDHVLSHWRVSGWAPSWYAGFPVYQFYMVIPPLAIVVLNVVLPYNVAFKIVSVTGLLTLPIAAWAMGRLARLRYPMPALLAVGTLPFLFDRGFSIYGGNIASTMAGEFNFSCALSLCLLYLGLLMRVCDQRKGRAITAVVLALTVLSHLLVGIFAVFSTFAVLAVYSWPAPGPDRWKLWRPRRLWEALATVRFAAPSLITAVALSGFWSLPFWHNRTFTIDMGWHKLTDYWHQLFSPRLTWALLLSVLAIVKLLRERLKPVAAILMCTIVMGCVFRFVPDGRLWNARMLPFPWLGLYLLAAIGAVEAVHQVASALGKVHWPQLGTATALGAAACTIVYVGVPMGALGLSGNTGGGTQHWGLFSAKTSYLSDWIKQNYNGYERRTEWAEYKAINDTMAQVGKDHGCGRALWEYDDKRLGSYGTPLSMMLLPYWTKGCIDSMEGLYFESSPTTPFHFLMAAEVTLKPSNPVTFPNPSVYRSLDLSHGIEHMQLYGIRYYMALTTEAKAQADARPELTKVATSGPWSVYQLSGSDLVTGLDRVPYVEAGAGSDWIRWRDTGLATWDPINGHRYYAATDGPPDWKRIHRGDAVPDDVVAQPPVVSNVATDDEHISFNVDQIGKPVLVKVNYFPNWTASGADGPYRVTPNLMVVVPRSTTVELTYGRTATDWIGMGLTAGGIVAVAYLAVTERRRRNTPGTTPAVPLLD